MSTATHELTGRVLPPSEWQRVGDLLADVDETPLRPETTKLLAIEKGGEIVATFSSEWMVYLSHLTVREDLRGGLLAEMLARRTIELYPRGTRAFMHTESRHVERLAHRMGMIPRKGSGWLWRGDG